MKTQFNPNTGRVVDKKFDLLIFSYPSCKGKRISISKDCYIGRRVNPEDVPLSEDFVADRHGKIFYGNMNGRLSFFYQDLGSDYGTAINNTIYGKRNTYNCKNLRYGDVISIGAGVYKKDRVIMIVCPEGIADGNAEIIHEELDRKEPYIIGRELDGLDIEDKTVSQHHASLRYSNGKWKIKDLHSKNGLRINNNPVNYRYTDLWNTSVIRVGDCNFIYADDKLYYFESAAWAEHLKIDIAKHSVGFIKKKTLLSDIKLDIPKGNMVMLLGGSGAGKTTLINGVLGFEPDRSIDSTIGKINLKSLRSRKYKGYVPQQDLMRLEDTVFHTVMDAGLMSLSAQNTRSRIRSEVEKALKSVGLSEEHWNKTLKKLSGGQRKRVSIAIELIKKPKIFVLDEPDSGLDGAVTISIMKQLREIANDGKTIIWVITHTPDRIASYFSDLVVLAKASDKKGGQIAYQGEKTEGLKFFGTSTYEGIIKKINNVEEGGEGQAWKFISEYSKKR